MIVLIFPKVNPKANFSYVRTAYFRKIDHSWSKIMEKIYTVRDHRDRVQIKCWTYIVHTHTHIDPLMFNKVTVMKFEYVPFCFYHSCGYIYVLGYVWLLYPLFSIVKDDIYQLIDEYQHGGKMIQFVTSSCFCTDNKASPSISLVYARKFIDKIDIVPSSSFHSNRLNGKVSKEELTRRKIAECLPFA